MRQGLFVTLTGSHNNYLTYPCDGYLEMFEIGSDGSLIVGVFRKINSEGSISAPVEVRNVRFVYGD